MNSFLAALSASFVSCWLLLRFERWHSWASHDLTSSGPQKFHTKPTPRIGGVPVAIGALVGLMAYDFQTLSSDTAHWLFAVAVAPAFLSGIIEDLTKKIGADIRLWASFLSALLCILFFDLTVQRIDIPLVDRLFGWYPISLAFTVFAIGGISHAMNIIDGYNGLAGMVCMLMLSAIAVVAWQVGDTLLLQIALVIDAATAGFFVWNWPGGRIFAGDGGAYLWGVSVGILAVMLVGRHPSISPWFALLLVAYPVTETLFTIYRRKFVHCTASGAPDAMHLHQLVYRRLLNVPPRSLEEADRVWFNSATSPFLWCLSLIAIIPAMLFSGQAWVLIVALIAFVFAYVWIYRSIARFTVASRLKQLVRRLINYRLGA